MGKKQSRKCRKEKAGQSEFLPLKSLRRNSSSISSAASFFFFVPSQCKKGRYSCCSARPTPEEKRATAAGPRRHSLPALAAPEFLGSLPERPRTQSGAKALFLQLRKWKHLVLWDASCTMLTRRPAEKMQHTSEPLLLALCILLGKRTNMRVETVLKLVRPIE